RLFALLRRRSASASLRSALFVPLDRLQAALGMVVVDRLPELRLPVRPVADLAERPAALGGQDHVGLALVGLAPRLVGLRLEPPGLVPVDRQFGQDLERSALAGTCADLGQVEPAGPQQLAGDAVLRLFGAFAVRILILPFVI